MNDSIIFSIYFIAHGAVYFVLLVVFVGFWLNKNITQPQYNLIEREIKTIISGMVDTYAYKRNTTTNN